MDVDLNRPIILYMHAGSGNHGCEAIADSSIRMIKGIREDNDVDTKLPVILATNSAAEDRRYALGNLEKLGLCTIAEERHMDRDFAAHVLYYAYRKLTGDMESFLRYRFQDVFRTYEAKCKKSGYSPYERGVAGHRPLAISIGGDNYCYPEMVPDLILAHSMFRRKGFATVLWGCSIEPKSLSDKALLDDLNAYDMIYAREPITYKALLEAGIDHRKVEFRRDPAFGLGIQAAGYPKGFIPGRTVGINLSPMVLERAKNPDLVKKSYTNFIRYILDNSDNSIALVPHVVWPSSDDRKPLSDLYNEFKDTGRVLFIEDASARVLKWYISCCSFFVGARTHSTIAAYSAGIPTLVIGYSVKSRGIATDLFGTSENYVLPVQDMEDPQAIINGYEWIMEHK